MERPSDLGSGIECQAIRADVVEHLGGVRINQP
jgi:hypothetical protein